MSKDLLLWSSTQRWISCTFPIWYCLCKFHLLLIGEPHSFVPVLIILLYLSLHIPAGSTTDSFIHCFDLMQIFPFSSLMLWEIHCCITSDIRLSYYICLKYTVRKLKVHADSLVLISEFIKIQDFFFKKPQSSNSSCIKMPKKVCYMGNVPPSPFKCSLFNHVFITLLSYTK